MTSEQNLRSGWWIVWLRVSDYQQDLERQHAAIKLVIDRHNLRDRILRTVELKHVSGRFVMDNAQVQRVVADLQKPEVMGVICDDQDRLFRMGKFGSIAILDEFLDNEKLILSPDGLVDLDSDAGFTTAAMKGVISGIDWRRIRRLCTGGKETKRQQGIHPNGPHTLALGVICQKIRNSSNRVVDCTWSYDGDYSERMRTAYGYLLDNPDISLSEILRRVGGYTDVKVLIGSLKNPIWKGFQRYATKAQGKDEMPQPKPDAKPYLWRGRMVDPLNPSRGERKKRKKQKPRRDPLLKRIDALANDPVVSEENWTRAQEIIERRALKLAPARRRSRSGDTEFLCLPGMLQCACGTTIYGHQGSHGHGSDSYRCNTLSKARRLSCGRTSYMRRIDLDETLRDMVAGKQLVEEVVRAVIAHAETVKTGTPQPPPRNEMQKREIEARQAQLFEQYRKKKISLDQFNVHLAELEEAMRILDTAPAPAPAPDIYDPERLVVALVAAFATFRRHPLKKQREVLQHILPKIKIEGRKIMAVTLSGGFLGGCIKATPGGKNTKERGTPITGPQLKQQSHYRRYDDLTVNFNKPIEIERRVQ